MIRRGSRLALALQAAVLTAAAGPAAAQNTYRWVDEKGVVQYSDQMPPQAIKKFEERKVQASQGNGQLPFAARKAAATFPVTLYVSLDCGKPCDEARALLVRRAVPFTETRLQSAEDVAAFSTRYGREPLVPTLGVGKEIESGFAASAWEGLLDKAGYPAARAAKAGPPP